VLDHCVLQSQFYVVVLAEEGTFLKAAKRLHTAQSFLTRKIGEIERGYRHAIFDRSTRSVRLTKFGRLIVPAFRLAIRESERAWELSENYSRLLNGPLRVGFSPFTNDATLRILEQMDISEFEAHRVKSADSPEPRVLLENNVTPELIERVLRGRLHASLGVLPIHNRGLWVEPVAHESFCICLPKTDGLAQRSTIAVRELHGRPLFWIPRDPHPEFYDQTVEYIRSTGAEPEYHEIGSAPHAMNLVAQGFGIALLPHSASRSAWPGVVFKPLADRFLRIETALFARRDLQEGFLKDFARYLAARLQVTRLNVQ